METMSPIRVLIVDDHDMLRQSIVTLLSSYPDIRTVGEAADGIEAIEVLQQLPVADHPHLALVDLKMPKMNGVETIRVIRERWPAIRCVALTSYEDKPLVRGVLDAGAVGYLLKSMQGADLATAIYQAYEGKITFSPEAQQIIG